MQSNNPVFRRSEEFNRTGGQTYAGYGNPSTWSTGQPGEQAYGAPQTPADVARMTIDSVVQKTAISLGVVVVAALATWVLSPTINENTSPADIAPLITAVTIGSLGAFALSMVNSFKKVISPALVLAFCALEGVALGGISKLFALQFGPGVVEGAVLGTFAAFGGTLAVYKYFNIKVGAKFQRIVMAGVFGMLGLAVMEMVLGIFGAELGLFAISGLGTVFAFVGLALGIFMLIMDFDFVEQGVANGLPERESWRAAFAMTVSLVWIYTNLLRILAFFSDN